MNDTDRQAFAECISALAVVYGKQADKAFLLGYWMFLEDVPIEDVRAAAMKAGRTLRFMPTAAELRELAGVSSAKQRAVMAWNAVCKAAADIGSYRSVWFEDPIVNAVIRSLGGWPRLLSLSGEEFDKWARMEFVKVYELIDDSVSPEECRPLPGLETRDDVLPKRVACRYVSGNASLMRLQKQSEAAQAAAKAMCDTRLALVVVRDGKLSVGG